MKKILIIIFLVIVIVSIVIGTVFAITLEYQNSIEITYENYNYESTYSFDKNNYESTYSIVNTDITK